MPVGYDTFEHSGMQVVGIQRGDQIREMHEAAETTFSGYFQGAIRNGLELVPLLFAATDPAGTISSDAFERLAGEALGMLRDGGPWDGVLLNQIGSMVTEEYPDGDGELARRTRQLVGPDIPIVMTLDLHANVSQQMADETDALVIYRTNPHLDAVPRDIDACDLIARMADTGWRPAKCQVPAPPMLKPVTSVLLRSMLYLAMT